MFRRKQTKSRAEMPFLDHLEELRWRILWSLTAVILGSIIGFWVVQNFDLLQLLKDPITPYLPEDKLFVTRPTDAFLITIKLAVVVGLVLGAPVIAYQFWSFLSPALYESEKRYVVPALLGGLGLFLAGALMAYLWVLPAIFRILFSFQREDLEFIITANEYFSFAIQIILAFGIVFQTPLFITLVSALGVLSPGFFARNRPYAIALASLLAAFLTPPDIFSMLMMMLPVLLLYELGIVAARLVWRQRKSGNTIGTAALILLALGTFSVIAPPNLTAQGEERPTRDSARVREPELEPPSRGTSDSLRQLRDSLRAQGDSVPQVLPLDTAVARKLGLPTAPSRSFPNADSLIQDLMNRPGYRVTRYAADSLTLYAETKQIDLTGQALVERDASLLEADTVSFVETECRLVAGGDPALFEGGSVLVGQQMRYDTCENRGIVTKALTNFEQSGVEWYLRGGLGVDSGSTRLYSASSDLTSCDEPIPHYHFAATRVKWVSNNIMVARPVVLYVRDVPVLWLPFMFQDMRRGRRSGWLVPRFGLNDLVRTSSGYRRHVSNIGYFFAINDYVDFQSSLDWFASNFISLNGELRYRWLNQFMNGGLSISRIWESGQDGSPGGRSLRLVWNHRQEFDMRTRLNASVNYATSARVVERNAVDPFLVTATLRSQANFSKQYSWGTLSIGGNRSQNLSDQTVTEALPNLSLTPVPINLGENITWSPSFTYTNSRSFNQQAGVIELDPVSGSSDTAQFDTLLVSRRNTSFNLSTPLRIGRWTWQNQVSITEFVSNQRNVLNLPDPNDTTNTLQRVYGTDFSTGIDWNTSINLPLLFPSSWRFQPTLGIQNSTGGPFLLKNRFTGGKFVRQGKRLSLGAGLSPSLFGFFPGIGPLSRIRHSLSPLVRWSYAPSASVPEDYARALDPTGSRPARKSPTLHSVSFGLSQTFEGKFDVPEGDTLADPRNARKIKLLQLQTSPIEYDFEQAKEEGRNGWRTQTLSNTMTSELLPGFSLRLVHDLWDGQVGFDTTRFDPFLRQVSARFSISGRTIAGVMRLLGLRADDPEPEAPEDEIDPLEQPGSDDTRRGRVGLGGLETLAPSRRGGQRGFTASVTFDDQRSRTDDDETSTVAQSRRNNRTLGLSVSFSPTTFWSVSWNTQYNFTTSEFGQHVLRLDRDLHRWRATFSFVKAPNGNFAFNFFISLLDQPDIKFQYDQRTINQ